MNPTLYDRDFYEWTVHNAELLRSGQLDQIDVENIAEEISSMGLREHRQMESRMEMLIAHLLKWELQTDHRSRSWDLTIAEQRRKLTELLESMPSLKPYLCNETVSIYRAAIFRAQKETKLPRKFFPGTCPYSFDQILDPKFLPE